MSRAAPWISLVWAALATPAAAADEPLAAVACGPPFAAIVSPTQGAEVPREGTDPACDEPGYCMWINVEGRISDCYWPYVGVTPHETKPLFWVMDPIVHVDRTDGSFATALTLGRGRDGLNERFDIFVIAHRRQNRFFGNQALFGVPSECRGPADGDRASHCFVSEAVTVRRVK